MKSEYYLAIALIGILFFVFGMLGLMRNRHKLNEGDAMYQEVIKMTGKHSDDEKPMQVMQGDSIGYKALQNNAGTYNVGIGYEALQCDKK